MGRWANELMRRPSASCQAPLAGKTDSPVIPETGLCPSSRGGQSWLEAGHPACVAPMKRPRMYDATLAQSES